MRALVLVGTLLSLVIGTAAPAGADAPPAPVTGGCGESATIAGFQMGVCISNRGYSRFIYPDVYVNQSAPGTCELTIEVWDDSGVNKFLHSGHTCAGHQQSGYFHPLYANTCSRPLHTSVWITYQGTFHRIGDSPPYSFCRPGSTPLGTGGCRDSQVVDGFQMSICIRNPNQSDVVEPSVVIHRLGVFGNPQDSPLHFEVWDDRGHMIGSTFVTYYVGGEVSKPVSGIAVPVDDCPHPVHASVWIADAGDFYRIGDSPEYTYC